jgi:hypothetical protein
MPKKHTPFYQKIAIVLIILIVIIAPFLGEIGFWLLMGALILSSMVM